MDRTRAPLKPAQLRLAVVGAGLMGRNHLRAAKAAGIEIAGVMDADADRAHAAAAEFGCTIAPDLRTMGAVVIAIPTAAHAATALTLLQAGIHCLIEKPLAPSEAECEALIDAAETAGAVLQVGHVERFNPAVDALLAQGISPTDVTLITSRRTGPAGARVSDVSVVADLMVHDLDIVLALKPLPVTQVRAIGNRDHAEAELTFADGAIATLVASRVAASRQRDLVVKTGGGEYRLDFIAKSLLRPARPARDPVAAAVFTGDALSAQLKHFVASIRGEHSPRVTGEIALDAMRLVWRIEAALEGL